jgi:tRNA threonylcarbamoyl adenosine modification protein YeaZ
VLGLALDSAGQLASAALWIDGVDGEGDPDRDPAAPSFAVRAYQSLSPAEGKADQLILAVEQLLETTGSQYQDLDVIAVNRGPGSFTGIRSAVALGRGLALAIRCSVIGVTTHEALAATLGSDDEASRRRRPRGLMIAQDARRGQVYRQGFDADLSPIDDLSIETPEATAERLRDGQWLLSGSGASLVRPHLDDEDRIAIIDHLRLDAKGVALAAAARLGKGEAPVSGFDLKPLYIRPPDAIRPKPFVTPNGQPAEAGA